MQPLSRREGGFFDVPGNKEGRDGDAGMGTPEWGRRDGDAGMETRGRRYRIGGKVSARQQSAKAFTPFFVRDALPLRSTAKSNRKSGRLAPSMTR